MKRLLLLLTTWCLLGITHAQLLTWTPSFAKDGDNISITLDASKGNLGLFNYTPVSDVYVHTGVITNLSTSPTNWRYVKFNQNFNQPNPLLQATSLGGNKWRFDITNIRAYYGVPAGETILKISILFRNGNGTAVQRNADGSDMYIPVYPNAFRVRLTEPFRQPTYDPIPEPINKQVGDNITLTGISSTTADNMKLWLGATLLQDQNNVSTVTSTPVLTQTGLNEVILTGALGGDSWADTIRFFVAPSPVIEPLPAGLRDGINYEAGHTAATLVLYAPNKQRVSLIGEFPGASWNENLNYMMKKTPDGNYWWLRVTGLTPGTEYAFQYLVNGSLRVGDPYAEKILDPFNDGFITPATYPALKPYPTGATGIVSVLQTNAPAYNWTINNFQRPDKRNLVIYELLLRDFLAAHDWKTLKDTLSYLRTLGVNAIEIMPFNEFGGNESWGYNPDYFLAPDKYYGPKNSLKEFIDTCHRRGIAVIMDIALNHTTGANPLAALYWNAATNQPAADNPWLNETAKHPYNVFNDFNHESLATRYFSSRVIEHWLQEYKLDGFRFDLSKGFTQNTNCGGSTTNESCFMQYDASRVAIWKRYYDTTQLKSPGSYAILEHFAVDNEEIELSNYGMLLWGNNSFNFQEAAMGWVTGTNSNFERYLHSVRGWSQPHLVSYMESHDEERLMYKNLVFGNNTTPAHNVRDLNTALKRIELCGAFFLAGPGPKMIWQFGELGYDFSINRCPDGTISNDCRLSNKPIRWDYKDVVQRKRIYDVFSAMNKLRFHAWYKDVFTANSISITRNLVGAIKTLTIRSAIDTSMMYVIGNFEVTPQTGSFTFPVAGTWYDYLGGGTFTATGGAQNITLQPGEYHVFLNRNLTNAVVTSTLDPAAAGNKMAGLIYPNPAGPQSVLEFYIPQSGKVQVDLLDQLGQKIKPVAEGSYAKGKHQLLLTDKINNLPSGIYYLRVHSGTANISLKLLVP